MKNVLVATCLLLFVFISACASSDSVPSELTPITVQLGSSHQALYAGLYVAEQNGYFAEEGLEVSFIEGDAFTDLTAPLLEGTAQFGLMGASAVILARAEEQQPIRAIAAVLRRDPIVFFSLEDSGIIQLEDFINKRVFVTERVSPRLYAMLGHAGIDSDTVTQVSTGGVAALYSGDVDVASGLITSTVLSAMRNGYSVNIIYPDNYGVHFYSVVVYTTDAYISTNPNVVTRFLQAALRGWTFAVENPQAVGALVTLYNPASDPEFETASMTAYLPYIHTGEEHIGWMKAEIWGGMAVTMLEQGELAASAVIDELYTMEFLQQIYEDTTP